MDIEGWLRSLGLERYAEPFRANDVDERVLPNLRAEDLREMGVASVGHRRLLLEAIAALRAGPGDTDAARTSASQPGASAPAPADGSRAERRQLTVMFVDLVGSTELSRRLDPEEMHQVLRAYQNEAAGEVARFEGHVAKFMGDGVLAYFGWPRAHEDEAERAVRAGLAVAEAVGRMTVSDAEPLAVRVGIATGLVVVGELVGEGAAQEETVAGETPNLAARLQTLAAPGQVVIAESTRRLLGELFEVEDLGCRPLKGLGEAVVVYRVLGESALEGRFEALHAAGLVPLVGREHELALLLDRWQRAKGGEGQAVLLSGEPGIGKSRLALALRERLRSEERVSLRYHGSPYHSQSALWPIMGQLERAAGFAREDDAATKLGKLEALLGQAMAEPRKAVILLAALLGVPAEAPPEMTPAQRKARIFAVLLAQLEGLAARRPVLVTLEDAHWLDPTTLELFDSVIERIQRLPVLLVATFRPEFKPPWTGHAHIAALTLSRLGRHQAATLVGEVAAGKPLPKEVLTEIVARTDGVPLFAEELTKAVLESGLLREEDGRYVLAGPFPRLAIPATLHDSLLARLDRLAPVKEVAQLGAVIGREFSHELLAAVVGMEEAALDGALAQLAAAELIFRRGQPPEATYVFKHALVQDAAYASLLRSRRQELHARVAQVLEERFPEVPEAEPEVLARHLTEGGLPDRAVPFWHKAGQRAAERSALKEATAHLAMGLKLLAELGGSQERARQELALRLTLGPVFQATRGWAAPEVEETYVRAQELARQVGEPSELFTVTWNLWHLRLNLPGRDRLGTAQRLVGDLLALARGQPDPGLLLQAHHAAWTTLFNLPALRSCREHTEQGRALYDAETHRSHKFIYGGHDPGVCCRNHHALALCLLGHPDQAAESAREAAVAAERLSHPLSRVQTAFFSCLLAQFSRDADAARERAEATAALCVELGIAPHFVAMSEIVCGWAVAVQERAREGISRIRRGIAELGRLQVELRRPYYLALLAEACGRIGQAEEGLEALAQASRVTEACGECFWGAEVRRIEGELLLAVSTERRPDAEAILCHAVELAREQDARLLELRAAGSLARLWAERGEGAKAHDLLAPVYGWFTEGFDTPDLQDARALLDGLR